VEVESDRRYFTTPGEMDGRLSISRLAADEPSKLARRLRRGIRMWALSLSGLGAVGWVVIVQVVPVGIRLALRAV
jgi:hypothetical protein